MGLFFGKGKCGMSPEYGHVAVVTKVYNSGAVEVATTRPETMLADMCVAVNPEDARYTRDRTGSAFAGWFSFQPLWDWITAQEPDLFN